MRPWAAWAYRQTSPRAALFLSSPLADYVSGRTLLVDGGVGAKFAYDSLSADD